jgi:hypothetical protein
MRPFLENLARSWVRFSGTTETEKADMMKRPKNFYRVGLLIDESSGLAEVQFV